MDYFNSVHRSLRAHATRTRAAACAHRRLSCALSRSGFTTWTRSSTTSTTTPPRAARSSRSTPPRASTPTPSSRPPSRCASRPAPSRRPWPSLRCSFNARHADATRVLMCRPRASGRSATTISSRLATTPTPTGALPRPPPRPVPAASRSRYRPRNGVCAHTWFVIGRSGYFTSRPALKRQVRVATNFLNSARQMEVISGVTAAELNHPCVPQTSIESRACFALPLVAFPRHGPLPMVGLVS